MKPVFDIRADNADVTAVIAEHFISMRIVDKVGSEHDELEIVLDDSNYQIEAPRQGVELSVSLGYLGSLRHMGVFAVDGCEFSGWPSRLKIRAKAANLSDKSTDPGLGNALKEYRSRSWHEETLGSIVETIASECEYACKISSDLSAIPVNHIDQVNESNSAFLLRLAKKYGAVFKPTFRELCIFKNEESANEWVIDTGQIKSYRMPIEERESWSGIKAQWHDHEAAQTLSVSVGTSPFKELPGTCPSEFEATKLATAELSEVQRGKKAPSVTLVGDPRILAGDVVVLAGPRAEMSGSWKCKEATHNLDSRGYETSLSLASL